MEKAILCIYFFGVIFIGHGQDVTDEQKRPRPQLKPDRAYYPGGQIALITDLDAVYLNFGGPGVRLTVGDFSFSFNMLPSLRFSGERVIPTLGAGTQFFYKRLIVLVPFYYIEQKWRVAGGIGYRIGN